MKNEFLADFYFIFLFFFLKNFFTFEDIWKNTLQIRKGPHYTFPNLSKDLSWLIKWRAGGAPSPPGFQVS